MIFSRTAGVQKDVTCLAGDRSARPGSGGGRRTWPVSARPNYLPESLSPGTTLLAALVTALALRSSPVTGLCFLSPRNWPVLVVSSSLGITPRVCRNRCFSPWLVSRFVLT